MESRMVLQDALPALGAMGALVLLVAIGLLVALFIM
jgi:hypothetical protein